MDRVLVGSVTGEYCRDLGQPTDQEQVLEEAITFKFFIPAKSDRVCYGRPGDEYDPDA